MRKVSGLIAICAALTGVASAQLQGRVVASGAERSDILVSLQRETGQIVHQAFTSSRGTFLLEGVGLFSVSNNNPYYLVSEEDGYKPYRRRLQQLDFRGGGAVFTVYLEPEEFGIVTASGDEDGSLTVDVRQLQVEIPRAAFMDYEDALEAAADGDHERAVERLERAVEAAPDYYDAWIDLGGQYDRVGRYEDAKAAYTEASEVNPAGALAALNLGALYYRQGERESTEENVRAFGTYGLAREWLEKTIDLNPASAEARFFLGAALYRMDLYAESEEMLQTALTLEEGFADARLLLINVYTRQNRYPDALDQAVAFLAENPDAPQSDAIERVRSQIEDVLGR